MNKKGFTLVELVVVVVILAIIALIAIPAVMRIIRDGRERRENIDVGVVLSGGYDYMLKDISRLPTVGNPEIVTLRKIISEGILRIDLTECKPKPCEPYFNMDDCIRVTNHEGVAAQTDLKPNEQYFGTYFFEYFEYTSTVCQ